MDILKFIRRVFCNEDVYLNTINELEIKNGSLMELNDIYLEELDSANKTIANNNKEIASLNNKINDLVDTSVKPLSFFMTKKPTKYRYKPDINDYLHKSLDDFSKDEEYVAKYFAFMQELGIKDNYSTVDKCVYDVVIRAQKYINETLPDDYDSDLESFGYREYWLSPKEAFDYYVEDMDVGDCEDTSAFLYGCVMSVLINYQYTDALYRLMRTDIDFPCGHAVAIWLKENNVWACIESTYGESRFSKNWVRDKDMFKGVYTGIWHVFNETTEYELKY